MASAPSSTDTPVAQSSFLSATKHAAVTDVDHDGRTGLGDRITWSLLVTNTGTVTVHGVAIVDVKSGSMTCAATSLAPGASTTCTAAAPYTITQPDVDAGVVDNTATATGVDPGGAPVTSPPASVSTPVATMSGLSLVKQAAVFDVNGDRVNGLGDTISWTFRVTNTGSTTLTALAVDDPVAGAVTCPVTTLAPARVDDLHRGRAARGHPGRRRPGRRHQHGDGHRRRPRVSHRPSAPSSTDTELDQLGRAPVGQARHWRPT